MDDFGVDAQMVFTTWWLLYPAANPVVEAALHRSYNRWMAERIPEAGGRLRWALMAPVRNMERAMEEMEFGKAAGASSVFLLGEIPTTADIVGFVLIFAASACALLQPTASAKIPSGHG